MCIRCAHDFAYDVHDPQMANQSHLLLSLLDTNCVLQQHETALHHAWAHLEKLAVLCADAVNIWI